MTKISESLSWILPWVRVAIDFSNTFLKIIDFSFSLKVSNLYQTQGDAFVLKYGSMCILLLKCLFTYC